MTAAPLFSVVMPTHNRAALAERAVRSVSAQTLGTHELVIVDDASVDGTRTRLAPMLGERVRLFVNQHNRGVSASRNRGVGEARGQYIVFLDDDDELRANALEAINRHRLTHPDQQFFWGGRLIHEKDASGRLVAQREDQWTAVHASVCGAEFLPFVLMIATNAAFTMRRDLLLSMGGFDESLKVSEDRDLFIRLARAGLHGGAVARTIIDVDEHFNSSLSRSAGVRIGPEYDLRIIDRYQDYLQRPEHRKFLNTYLLTVFAAFLQAGDRHGAARTVAELHQRNALKYDVFRMYVRHAPEFRALKTFFRYNTIRRMIGASRRKA